MIYKDEHIKEEEIKELEEIYSSVISKNPKDGVIQEEIYSIGQWKDDYEGQLHSLSKNMTDKEKKTLIENCKRVSRCDGYIDERESYFLQDIYSTLNYSQKNL